MIKSRDKFNNFKICGDIAKGMLSNGLGFIIDAEDFSKIRHLYWSCYYARKTWYVVNQKGPRHSHKQVRLHRFLMGSPEKKQVDHINGDGLDNRKINLRICTIAENIRNQKRFKPGFKGVGKHREYWRARIMLNRKEIYLGQFKSKVDAARAYDQAAKKYYGEFACLNFKEW